MFIVSRASQDNEYVVWETTKNGQKAVKKTILIKGGANVLDKHTMTTPNGVVTEISDEDYEILKEHTAFKRHMERGFMEVLKEEKKARASSKTKTNKKDGSAQLTPKDFEDKGQKAPDVSRA